jgi:hypothetical protein
MSYQSSLSVGRSADDFEEFMNNFQDWSANDVLNWIKIIGFGKYATTFEYNNIDGYDLVSISVNDLTDIGLERLEARKLFREISRLLYVEFVPKDKKRQSERLNEAQAAPESPVQSATDAALSRRKSKLRSTKSELPKLSKASSVDSKSRFLNLFARK